MIAVCLLTCGREELTQRTVETFFAHNQCRNDLIRLHANCGGDKLCPSAYSLPAVNHNCAIAELGGFQIIHEPTERVPQMVSFRKLIDEAAVKGAEFVLWLENDWESVAPLPSLEFLQKTADEGVMTWRMFGARKMRENGPRAMAGEHLIGTDIPIHWQPSVHAGWEYGRAHWGGGGCIATLDHLERQMHRLRLKDVVTATANLKTLRSVKNIMFHIGQERTPGLH